MMRLFFSNPSYRTHALSNHVKWRDLSPHGYMSLSNSKRTRVSGSNRLSCPHRTYSELSSPQPLHPRATFIGTPIPPTPIRKKPRSNTMNITTGFGLTWQPRMELEWNASIDPNGRWLAPRKDGLRFYWDGEGKISSSSFKRLYTAPEWLIQQLPKKMPVEGEICSTDGFETCVQILTSPNADLTYWKSAMTVWLSDVPKHPGVYKDRYEFIKTLVPHNHPILRVLPMTVCKGLTHMLDSLNQFLDEGGEGMLMIGPHCTYDHPTSLAFLSARYQLEQFGEARVLSHAPSSLQCELPEGQQFKLPFSNMKKFNLARLTDAFPVGTVVTFTQSDCYNSGKPRNAKFCRARNDLTWNEVLAAFKKKKEKIKRREALLHEYS